MPDGWQPTKATVDGLVAELTKAGLVDRIDVRREFTKFEGHARANARKLADWDAGYRNWVRQAVEFAERDTRNGKGPRPCWPNGLPLTPHEIKSIQQTESRKACPDLSLLALVGITPSPEQRAAAEAKAAQAAAVVDEHGFAYDGSLLDAAPKPQRSLIGSLLDAMDAAEAEGRPLVAIGQ
nr:hypothetical protein [Shuttle vector pDA71]